MLKMLLLGNIIYFLKEKSGAGNLLSGAKTSPPQVIGLINNSN